MLEINFLQMSAYLHKKGFRGRILPMVQKCAKAEAAGQPFRITNLPGNTVEVEGHKYIITKKGKLNRIS